MDNLVIKNCIKILYILEFHKKRKIGNLVINIYEKNQKFRFNLKKLDMNIIDNYLKWMNDKKVEIYRTKIYVIPKQI